MCRPRDQISGKSSNGRTADSESANVGSTPTFPAKTRWHERVRAARWHAAHDRLAVADPRELVIAIKGKDFIVRHFDHVPTLTKDILCNRKILADQMEFLLQGVPKDSRMHVNA